MSPKFVKIINQNLDPYNKYGYRPGDTEHEGQTVYNLGFAGHTVFVVTA